MQHRRGALLVIATALAMMLPVSNAAAVDPVVYTAGDIACAPGSSTTSTTCRERFTSDIVVAGGAARALALGDLQYDSASLSNLQNSYNNTWGRFKSITSPSLGNHENSGSGYFDYFYGSGVNNGPYGERNKGWYSFDVGTWHLIGLNSNCSRVACTAGSEQETWLRNDLATHQNSCTLAFWHHPRWSSGHDGNGTFMQPMWQALYNADADLALVGHSHHYERFAPQNASGGLDTARGIRQFVVGTGGAFFTGASNPEPNSEVRQNHTFGVLKLTLHSNSYTWQFMPEAGKTFTDSGTTNCHGGPPPPPDTVPPSIPQNLSANATSSSVELSWDHSTDNRGVTGYEIYRNDVFLTSVTGTTHSDTPVSPDTTYTYKVRAFDAAGWRSGFSTPVEVTTPSTVSLSPVADARVIEASPTVNNGTSYLRTDGGTDPDVESFLKFTVSGLTRPVQSATLRVFAYTDTSDGPAVYGSATGWVENTVNWSTRPATTSGAVDDMGAVAINTWMEYDVSPLVTGNGTFGLRLATTSSNGVDIRSREDPATAQRPQLVLALAPQDTDPPSDPENLSADAIGPTQVDLSWDASTDNIGVTGYEIHRNGSLLTTVTGTTHSDLTANPETHYSYQVRAIDGAGLHSGFSNTAEATTPAPPDTEDPTAPTLNANPISSTRVDLSWSGATDNVGVMSYEIYRNGTLLTSTASTSHADVTALPQTAYGYQVRALDAASNRSPFSNTQNVTTPATQTARFRADADAAVKQANPFTNFGSDNLGTDGGPDQDVESYLRFTVSGTAGPVLSAKLRLHAFTTTVDGPAAYKTTSAWTERGMRGINWSNRPARTSPPNDDKGALPTGWLEWDVTSLVNGNGTHNFVLATSSADEIDFLSREQTTFRPMLVVTY